MRRELAFWTPVIAATAAAAFLVPSGSPELEPNTPPRPRTLPTITHGNDANILGPDYLGVYSDECSPANVECSPLVPTTEIASNGREITAYEFELTETTAQYVTICLMRVFANGTGLEQLGCRGAANTAGE